MRQEQTIKNTKIIEVEQANSPSYQVILVIFFCGA